MTRRAAAALALAAAGLSLPAAPAAAEQTTTQRFFAARLLADERTSPEIQEMLRTRRGFVDRRVVFRDLTGDGRTDAVVKVQSGGAAGAVALYVFSTDTGRRGSALVAVFRSQALLQAETRVRDGVLRYRSARPARGEELCCAARVTETRLRWRERRHRLRVAERREVASDEPWGGSAPPAS